MFFCRFERKKKMKEIPKHPSEKEQSEYFEWVGKISARYAALEYEILRLLANLSNPTHKEIAYFFAERESAVSRKYDTILSLIKLKPYKKLLGKDLIQKIINGKSELKKVSEKRNRLLHSMLSVRSNKDGTNKLAQIQLSPDKEVFEIGEEYSIGDIGNIYIDILMFGHKLSEINKEVKDLICELN